MDDTKYRRAVHDMRKAGLNPILAAGGVSTGAAGAPTAPNIENELKGTAQNVREAALAKETMRNIKVDTDRKFAEEQLTWEKYQTERKIQRRIESEIMNIAEQTRLNANSATSVQYDNVLREIEAQFYQNFEAAGIAKKFGVSADTVRGIIQSILGGKPRKRR